MTVTTNHTNEDDHDDHHYDINDRRRRPSTWREWKARATEQFHDGNYDGALYSYTQALRPDLDSNNVGRSTTASPLPPPSPSSSISMSNSERQILLSNIVACRLKLGGRAQAAAAVETAKQCIGLDPQWAKGHIRLASALIAMDDPTKSNDACRALQKAMQLDPGNPTARTMLVKELRRDHRDRYRDNNSSNNDNNNDNDQRAGAGSSPNPSAPPDYMDDNGNDGRGTRRNFDESSPSTSSSTDATHHHHHHHQHHQQQQQHRGYGSTDSTTHDSTGSSGNTNNRNSSSRRFQDDVDDIDIDDVGTTGSTTMWRRRFEFYYDRAKTWYNSQSDDVKTLLKVMVVLLCLYVALGGRFGFEYIFGQESSRTRRRQEILSRYDTSSSSSTSYGSSSSSSSSSSTATGRRRATTTAGNYDEGNAYDEFYKDRYRRQTQQGDEGSQYQRYQNNYERDRRYDSTYDHHRHYHHHGGQRRTSSSYYYGGDTGGVPNMLILAGVAYAAHRMGISPFQALLYANMILNGGRGRRMFGPGFGGGMGGFGRARYGGRRHRPGGGMWWG